MATITNAKVSYGLYGTGTPSGTNLTGSVTVGKSPTGVNFTTGDILYSFTLLSTGATDVATLTISSGAVAQTTGTPTITDGDGKDFEGVTLSTLVTPYILMVEPVGTTTGQFIVASSSSTSGITKYIEAGETSPLLCTFPSSGTIAFTFAASADSFKVTILGKSS